MTYWLLKWSAMSCSCCTVQLPWTFMYWLTVCVTSLSSSTVTHHIKFTACFLLQLCVVQSSEDSSLQPQFSLTILLCLWSDTRHYGHINRCFYLLLVQLPVSKRSQISRISWTSDMSEHITKRYEIDSNIYIYGSNKLQSF